MNPTKLAKTSAHFSAFWLLLWTTLLVTALAPPVLADEQITYITTDHLGSPIMGTDEKGQVVWRQHYTPYGTRLEVIDPNYVDGYTGHYQDPNTGLVYAGARWYDPELGRFLSIDPKGFDENHALSFNRYAYANDNPQRYIDPDGESPVGAAAAILGWFGIGFGIGATNSAIMQYLDHGSVDNWTELGGVLDSGVETAPFGIFAGAFGRTGGIAATEALSAAAARRTLVTGRTEDLSHLSKNEQIINLQLKATPKDNWRQNSAALREHMRSRSPIRDAPPGDNGGYYLNAERNLLREHGWTFDKETGYWAPPN